MHLPTKQLISKIEQLSKELSPEQLTHFLDIIDAMSALVLMAKEERAASCQQQALTQGRQSARIH